MIKASQVRERCRLILIFVLQTPDLKRSLRAVEWGAAIAGVLMVASNFMMFIYVFPGRSGPSLNTDVSMTLCEIVIYFLAHMVGGYAAATLAPSSSVRHAVASGLPLAFGAVVGFFLNLGVVLIWNYPAVAVAILVASFASGKLREKFPAARQNVPSQE